MTRFVTHDPAAAAAATDALRDAARSLAATITVAATKLNPHAEDPFTAEDALVGLERWVRGEKARRRRVGALLLLLHEAGVSERALADRIGLGRHAVAQMVADARVEREANA
ncbi:chromosome partitioning protein [Mycobacteroides abscessus subsp. massiliense]|uniref:chromosome partitioning protein n=1 Tax=Mycobacteroides abscessus TaxID=36809 RepID=UPI0009A75651|nr:chromosome partitioning protein [Mycobacteroides abscessus]SKE70685.1 chromosome partitioning protein [Mycobacteroides abscessus subsp. massiliense]SKH80572.1 chromosome partitioning protein [Mycobacteroides abscessus subsp. massiliense]SKI34241.1 chromosome partitioning protein [Mycobacteroides abscessus subsp. massiliense]SKJ36840.1 chromosome partitioning protein [Mycobacteroides abscessus subsp. massiliense]SKK23267.1 chromosome partitioning protein [Mycobacteroides abscessus subsp. mas